MKLLVILLLLVNTAWARNEPSVLLYDNTTNTVLLAEHTQQVRPMASITKVMTAMTYLDLNHDLEPCWFAQTTLLPKHWLVITLMVDLHL
jgi:hypothetical protein